MATLRSLIHNNKGFTLLELVIALSILGIISMIVSSILSFGLMATETGTDLRDEHGAVRMISTIITNDLRYAYDVKIVANGVSDNIDRSLYQSGDDFYRYDGVASLPVSKDLIQTVVFSIEIDGDRAYVDYQIVGVDGYEVNSRIYLENADATLLTEDSGSIITYDYVGNGKN